MFQKILIALGDDPAASQLLEQGLAVAGKLNASVLLLHVLNPLEPHGFNTADSPLLGGVLPMVSDAEIANYVTEWQNYKQQGVTRLQSYAEQAATLGIPAETMQGFGNAGPAICAAAQERGVDLIIVGRNQKSILTEIFLGSTSNDVLHHAHCSVLTIKISATQ